MKPVISIKINAVCAFFYIFFIYFWKSFASFAVFSVFFFRYFSPPFYRNIVAPRAMPLKLLVLLYLTILRAKFLAWCSASACSIQGCFSFNFNLKWYIWMLPCVVRLVCIGTRTIKALVRPIEVDVYYVCNDSDTRITNCRTF